MNSKKLLIQSSSILSSFRRIEKRLNQNFHNSQLSFTLEQIAQRLINILCIQNVLENSYHQHNSRESLIITEQKQGEILKYPALLPGFYILPIYTFVYVILYGAQQISVTTTTEYSKANSASQPKATTIIIIKSQRYDCHYFHCVAL